MWISVIGARSNISTKFDVYTSFRSRLIGPNVIDRQTDGRTDGQQHYIMQGTLYRWVGRIEHNDYDYDGNQKSVTIIVELVFF